MRCRIDVKDKAKVPEQPAGKQCIPYGHHNRARLLGIQIDFPRIQPEKEEILRSRYKPFVGLMVFSRKFDKKIMSC
jgi:hypothetical protein